MPPPARAKESQVTDISRFEAVAERSLVDDVTVNVWGERLCLCDSCRKTEPGRVMIGTIRDFEAWGGDFDASAAPFFERRQVSSSVTGGTYESISPPRVTAAVYVGGTVAGGFPCQFGDTSYSVRDLSEALFEAVDRAGTQTTSIVLDDDTGYGPDDGVESPQ